MANEAEASSQMVETEAKIYSTHRLRFPADDRPEPDYTNIAWDAPKDDSLVKQYIELKRDSDQNISGLEFKVQKENFGIVKAWAEQHLKPANHKISILLTDLEKAHAQIENQLDKGDFKNDADIKKAAEELLLALVSGARPVADYTARFMVPLQMNKDFNEQAFWNHLNHVEPVAGIAKAYFAAWPELGAEPDTETDRDLGNRLRSYNITPKTDHQFIIEHGNYDKPLQATLQSAHIHRLIDGLAVLELCVGTHNFQDKLSSDNKEIRNEGEQALLTAFNPEGHDKLYWEIPTAGNYLSAAQVLDMLSELRLTHLTHERSSRGKITTVTLQPEDTLQPESTEMPAPVTIQTGLKNHDALFWEGPYGYVFKSAFNGDNIALKSQMTPLFGDRALGFISLVLDGPTPPAWASDKFAPLRHRLAELDPFGTGFDYDYDFSRDDLQKITYPRFAGWGTYFTANSHCFTHLGFRGRPRRPTASPDRAAPNEQALRGLFGWRFIHFVHMPVLYRRIFLLAVFQNAKLLGFTKRLAMLDTDDTRRDPEALISLRQAFLDFRTRYHPTRVSTEIQGQELYQRISLAMDIDARIAQIDARLASHEGFASMQSSAREAKRRSVIYYMGLPLAGLFLLLRLGGAPFAPWWTQPPFAKAIDFLNFFHFGDMNLGLFVYILMLTTSLTILMTNGLRALTNMGQNFKALSKPQLWARLFNKAEAGRSFVYNWIAVSVLALWLILTAISCF